MTTATIEPTPLRPRWSASESVPRLENGDHLTAGEFLRRYYAAPDLKKAELVDGTVFMASPVSYLHAKPDAVIQGWLFTYAARSPGTELLTNATVKLDAEDVVQPDALLRLLPENGGRSQVTPDKLLSGPPELIVEIAASSVSLDAGQKRRSYLRAGVREYLLWRVEDNAFDWWVWESYDYRVNLPDAQGIIRSPHFAGLALHVPALLAYDAAAVLATLEAGIKGR